jgi:hypothetical protein
VNKLNDILASAQSDSNFLLFPNYLGLKLTTTKDAKFYYSSTVYNKVVVVKESSGPKRVLEDTFALSHASNGCFIELFNIRKE